MEELGESPSTLFWEGILCPLSLKKDLDKLCLLRCLVFSGGHVLGRKYFFLKRKTKINRISGIGGLEDVCQGWQDRGVKLGDRASLLGLVKTIAGSCGEAAPDDPGTRGASASQPWPESAPSAFL